MIVDNMSEGSTGTEFQDEIRFLYTMQRSNDQLPHLSVPFFQKRFSDIHGSRSGIYFANIFAHLSFTYIQK